MRPGSRGCNFEAKTRLRRIPGHEAWFGIKTAGISLNSGGCQTMRAVLGSMPGYEFKRIGRPGHKSRVRNGWPC